MRNMPFGSSVIGLRLCLALALGAALFLSGAPAAAQTRAEYRGFWIETFNTPLNNHADVVKVVNNAKAAKANALFAQVRRRGDAWYLNSLEPAPDLTTPIASGFDPLQDLIATAHAEGIEVHAFVIIGAVWNKNPTIAGGAPTNPNHVFNLHGGYNPATKQVVPGPNNWLTRTLLLDNSTNGISFQGHRFNGDFWIDLGHPEAAAYTVDVLMHLVRHYDVDGLHLDRIRYPELTASGQTPSNGTNIGYNFTSVERFNRRFNKAGDPATGDPLWMQWRRDQVTNLVRRVYLNAVALKPQLKISAALIAFGAGPTTEASWRSAEAYWRVYQDWRAWTEEGILDIAIPMVYRQENTAATQYDNWKEWLYNHQYARGGVMGMGVYLNSVEGTLRQTRRALQPSRIGNSGLGTNFYSMATTNVAVTANPFSVPPGASTPVRSFADFAAGLTTGKSADGKTAFEDPAANPTPAFGQAAIIPTLPWKAAPTKGHLMGFARRADNTVLDTATVTIQNVGTEETRTTATDGGGFFGGVDLAPGEYFVKVQLKADTLYSCVTNVTAGGVATANAGAESTAPATTATLTPASPDGTNNWYTSDITFALDATDDCSGVARTEYSTNGGTTWRPYTEAFVIGDEGTTLVSYRSTDRAGNVETAGSSTVKLDKTAPVVTYSEHPDTYTVDQTVNITCKASDAVSGVASDTCRDISVPAYTFALGVNNFSATATDNAGHQGSNSTSFTVQVTFSSLGNLTEQFVAHHGIANSLTAKLRAAAAQSRGDEGAKEGSLNAYANEVRAKTGKALTAEQGAVLIKLAEAL